MPAWSWGGRARDSELLSRLLRPAGGDALPSVALGRARLSGPRGHTCSRPALHGRRSAGAGAWRGGGWVLSETRSDALR